MNAQTHKAIPIFALGFHFLSEIQANEKAREISLKYPNQFIYVILSTSTGKYRNDYMALPYSDERTISAYQNGEKTL